jgi:VIT1/CCC1 family predicted Fe2+/Mn2+ transporter
VRDHVSARQVDEPHSYGGAARLNWLRAGVLGANDGIVSVASIVVGVAGAGAPPGAILTAGAAALVGGAVSMALGEYISVSSQSDSQKAMIDLERQELAEFPDAELDELASLYEAKGLAPETARTVALELTAHDPLAAHLDIELNLAEDEIVSAWHAAAASAVSFLAGGVLPFLAILLLPSAVRVPGTFVVVLIALALTGGLGARLGGTALLRPAIRVVAGGAIALTATFLIGSLLGTAAAG